MSVSHWMLIEKLGEFFGHEWIGFYTWLAEMAEESDEHREALEAFDAWHGDWPEDTRVVDVDTLFPNLYQASMTSEYKDLIKVCEVFEEWLKVEVKPTSDFAESSPCAFYNSGLTRAGWVYRRGVLTLWKPYRYNGTFGPLFVVMAKIDTTTNPIVAKDVKIKVNGHFKHLGELVHKTEITSVQGFLRMVTRSLGAILETRVLETMFSPENNFKEGESNE